jgi:tetratricopeptide (TPR) repeat protein
MSQTRDPVLNALLRLLATTSWKTAQEIVEQNPALQDESIDFSLRRLIAASDPEKARALEEQRAVLQRCREVGVQKAFAEKMQPRAVMPEALRDSYEGAGEAYESYLGSKSSGDLEDATGRIERVLRDPSFPASGGNFKSQALSLAAKIYLQRYYGSGQIKELDVAVECAQKVVALFKQDVPELADHLNFLSATLSSRYDRTGDPADLTDAIRAVERAVSSTPPDSEDLPMHMINLAALLLDLYESGQDSAELDKAVRWARKAVSQTANDSPNLPRRANVLVNALVTRFNETQSLPDLEDAILVSERLVSLAPPNSSALSHFRNRLESLKRVRSDLRRG